MELDKRIKSYDVIRELLMKHLELNGSEKILTPEIYDEMFEEINNALKVLAFGDQARYLDNDGVSVQINGIPCDAPKFKEKNDQWN